MKEHCDFRFTVKGYLAKAVSWYRY
jgi:hypothetical protein